MKVLMLFLCLTLLAGCETIGNLVGACIDRPPGCAQVITTTAKTGAIVRDAAKGIEEPELSQFVIAVEPSTTE